MRKVALELSAHEMHEIVKALGERKSEYSAELYLKMKEVFYNWSKLPEVKEPEHPNCLGITLNLDGAEKEIDQLAEKIAESLSEATDNINKFF